MGDCVTRFFIHTQCAYIVALKATNNVAAAAVGVAVAVNVMHSSHSICLRSMVWLVGSRGPHANSYRFRNERNLFSRMN